MSLRRMLAGHPAWSFGLLAALAVSGCKKKPAETKNSAPEAVASTAQKEVASAAPASSAKPRGKGFPVAIGISLPLFPGRGAGPIRFGATQKTIERLMEAPCEHSTPTLCAYVARAIEFDLKEGAAFRMRAYRLYRRVEHNPEASYGVFNGGFANGVKFGMNKDYVKEVFGDPERVERVTEGGPPIQAHDGSSYSIVERHHYPGVILEYDKLNNGNIVLGAVILEKNADSAQSQ